MREVNVVKTTRDSLKEERIKVMAKIHKITELSTSEPLSDEDKKLTGYFYGVLYKLDAQINTLEYVLNEDTTLHDAFYTHFNGGGRDAFNEDLDFKEGHPKHRSEYMVSSSRQER